MAGEHRTFHKVVIQSWGTRGDAQPMAAIGLKMQEEGYDVTLLLPKDSVPFVESLGLKARGVFVNVKEEFSKGQAKEAMGAGDTFKFLGALTEINKASAEEQTRAWYEAVSEIKPDLCVSGTICVTYGMIMMRHFKVPTISLTLQPFPKNPPKMLMGLPNFPCCGLNARFMRFMTRTGFQNELDTIGVQFKKLYGIDWTQLTTLDDLVASQLDPAPPYRTLVGMDPHMAEFFYGGQENIPPTIKLLGFFAVESDKQIDVAKQGEMKMQKMKSNQFGEEKVLEDLEAFCAKGDPPAYFGFGSMTAGTPDNMVRLLCLAAKHAKARAIVCKGWANLSLSLLEQACKDPELLEYAKENIMFVGNTPHEWLFPRCSCIVHHGGAGTTATASRSGVPQVITPVWLDQWDTARFLSLHGAGIGFTKQLTKVGAFELGDAIKKTQHDQGLRAKAKEWQQETLKQQGATAFVREVRAWWTEEVVSGRFDQYHEEQVKKFKK